MSPKLILCLALVLSGGLLACSTIARKPHVASTDQYLWGEAVGGFQMATSLDETNGILHCWIRNAATNAVAYNDFFFGYSAHIRLEIRQGAEWARVGAEVFPGDNVVRGAVPINTKIRWLQPGRIITNTWMRRDTCERRKFQKATARETLLGGICEGDTFALDLVVARWWAYDILRPGSLEARVSQTFYSASPDDSYPYTHGPEITLYSPVFSLDTAAIQSFVHANRASVGPAANAHSDLEAIHRADWTDWRKVLESPAAAHDLYYSGFAERLKHSQVPTELEAGRRAISVSGDVDARTTWRVSALLRLARPGKDLGQAGDFVWEVRVVHAATNEDVAGLIWVSTTTGKAKVLYP